MPMILCFSTLQLKATQSTQKSEVSLLILNVPREDISYQKTNLPFLPHCFRSSPRTSGLEACFFSTLFCNGPEDVVLCSQSEMILYRHSFPCTSLKILPDPLPRCPSYDCCHWPRQGVLRKITL